MAKEIKIQTADGYELKVGDKAFNYYDGKYGTIQYIGPHPQPNTLKGQTSSTPQEYWDNHWFDFVHEDGTKAILDGSRITKER